MPSARVHAAVLALLLAGLPFGSPAAARPAGPAGGYPRIALYGSIHGNGSPFYAAPADTTFDSAALDQIARYDEVILDVNPITPYRPALIDELRRRNPDIRVLAYLTSTYSWPVEDPDSLNHVPTRYRHTIRNLGGFLYNSVDGLEFRDTNINLALRDGTGRYVVAEAVADFYANVILGNGPWDGAFLDVFCTDTGWMQDATHQIDYVRAGYPSFAAFQASWTVACDTLAHRLRRRAPAGALLVGNCGVSNHHEVFNGWMRENFPFQSGGTWASNVLADPHGYLADDRDFQAPAQNYLYSNVLGTTTPYTATNTHRVRYGLASAALGSSFAAFGTNDRNSETAPYHTWWYDEYAVDVATGQSATDLAHTHWLGQPRGGPYQMIWAGTNPDACSNPDFESNVTSGWNFGRFAPAVATLTQDTQTAAVGLASARVTVSTAGANAWDVNLATTTQLPLVGGAMYAATFWARSSTPRTLPVTATLLAGGEVARQTVTLDNTWRHYQVILQPASSTNAVLEFFLGAQAGDVWFDDVHFQRGATNVWRRDFDNGIVLVNPSDAALQVPLGTPFRHIRGTADLAVNDGSTVSAASVPAGDALFLLRTNTDVLPPASIQDTRVVP